MTRTCVICGNPTHQRKNESTTRYKKRKTCSRTCGRAQAARTKHAKHPTNAPTCQTCHKPITRNEREGSARYYSRQYCSRACASEAQTTIPIRVKTCGTCGKKIERDPKNSRWQHSQRKFCSPMCASVAGRKVRWERPRLAPDGYVFDGKFPTPASVTSWQPVSGPDTGVVVTTFTRSRATRCPTTLSALASAVRAHPDLGTALLGQLTDAWVQQDSAG